MKAAGRSHVPPLDAAPNPSAPLPAARRSESAIGAAFLREKKKLINCRS